jgi:spoIIIJ-associated protein
MTWVEVSGKTLDEAKEAAARELGVSVDEIEVEVLDEESKGFLGIGQSKVRIKAATIDNTLYAEEITEPATSDSSDESAPVGERAVALVGTILKAMQFEATPKLVSESDEEIQIDIFGESEDVGRLIGRHGQTIDALQYLVGIAINRDNPYKLRVLLDAEGYRMRHQQMIEAKALDLARRVKEAGEEAVLEPQNARDRRIMHMILADNPDVYTYSEGEGEDRHIVISPKK